MCTISSIGRCISDDERKNKRERIEISTSLRLEV